MDNERARERGSVIAEIQNLLLTTDSIDNFLSDVARLAARELAVDTYCGLTLQGEQGPATVASSDERAAMVDELQYTADDGPCLHAMRAGVQVAIDDLANETRWPEFCTRAMANGIRSSFSLPLRVDAFGKGALNLYAAKPQFFGPPQREIAEHFAGEAARAIALATRIANQVELTRHLRIAMTSRAVIDQAIGVVMSQKRCDARDAFAVLRHASQSRNVKLREVAAEIVTAVSGKPPVPPQFDLRA